MGLVGSMLTMQCQCGIDGVSQCATAAVPMEDKACTQRANSTVEKLHRAVSQSANCAVPMLDKASSQRSNSTVA